MPCSVRGHVGGQPFAVLLGDDLIDEHDHLLRDMVEIQRYRGPVWGVDGGPRRPVPPLRLCRGGGDGTPDVVRVTGMVEKPDPAEAPSNLAIIGRYVLHPRVFDVLRETRPGRGGEIPTDRRVAGDGAAGPSRGRRGYGVVFRGRRYDTGDRLAYLQAVVQIACSRPDLGPELRRWLRGYLAELDATVDGPGPGAQG